MENILSALEVNLMLLALILAVTFTVLGVIERSDSATKLIEARIENGFFATSSFVAFLVLFLM
ncbi:hypothetical protein C2869_09825 [Saccharobesus litoralis]|uniref:Uncharacterized protein n=1 Tax=Saccharobesus litoralis TaxID=2172099 RepID=A0A2S0VR77_9ALTE|nr:hypothetical protein [Saccharobesus litoralis]AWB66711.1 hypothetical protein C2869_09825 [Saccharobesus litoralis]